MDDLGRHEAKPTGTENGQGEGASSNPEGKQPASQQPQPLRDGHDVGKPPGTSYSEEIK